MSYSLAPKMVYFIKPVGMPGPVKIGCSRGPVVRLSGLTAWSPWPLEIIATCLGDGKLEKQLHEHFAEYHSHREWFHAHPAILETAQKIAAGIPPHEAADLKVKTGTIRTQAQKRKLSPENRQRTSYRMRLWWAEERAKRGGSDRYFFPADIDEIMQVWRPGYGQYPTSNDIARLDQVLASPEKHFITRSERFQNLRAA